MLITAGMITRFLGFINRIVLARLIGEEGVGLYMMAVPTLFLMITLAQIGLPIAISKRVAEANAKRDTFKIKQIMTISFIIITCTSIIFTLGMFFIAPNIANNFLTDERALFPLFAIIPIIPIIVIVSVIKGYFQGMQNMKPQSIAIVVEQFVRIGAVFVFVKWLLPYGIKFAAAGAMVSILFGEIASLLVLLFYIKHQLFQFKINKIFRSLKNKRNTVFSLFSIALPQTGSRLISSISSFLEPIIVSQSLAIAGVATVVATKQYGVLTGYAMPLLFLPTFITNSLYIALVPLFSEFSVHSIIKQIDAHIRQAIRISFASGALATVILSLFSIPILTYMYQSSNASKFIILMAPFFLFLYIQSPLQAALFGLDLAKQAMWNSLIGSIAKFIILFLLASNEQFGMMGVAIAICFSIILITCLHLITLYKAIQFTIKLIDLVKMFSLVGMTTLIGISLKNILYFEDSSIFAFILLLFILTVCYGGLLILFKFITKEELKQIPILQNFV